MAPTHVELYEALRGPVGEEAAAMIAEVVPPAGDLATKLDIAGVRQEILGLRSEIKDVQASLLRWMFGLFIPLWAGTWATVIAVIIKG